MKKIDGMITEEQAGEIALEVMTDDIKKRISVTDESPYGVYTPGNEPCWYVTVSSVNRILNGEKAFLISQKTGKIIATKG